MRMTAWMEHRWSILAATSVVVHFVVFVSLKEFSESSLARRTRNRYAEFTITRKEPVATPVPTVVVTPALEKPKVLPREAARPVQPTIVPTPLHGLTAESFAKGENANASPVAAPAGNSLLVEDTGKRVAPENVQPLQEGKVNHSESARLDLSTVVKPTYTKEAIRAALTGEFPVDVHVRPDGTVIELEFVRSVGFGMEERIRAALLAARFYPARDESGRAIEAWVTIQFRLELPS